MKIIYKDEVKDCHGCLISDELGCVYDSTRFESDGKRVICPCEIRPCPLAIKEFKVGEILPDDFDDYETIRTVNNYETSYLELTNGQHIKIDRDMKVLEVLNENK